MSRWPALLTFAIALVLAAALAGCARTPSAKETAAWDAEIARLEAEQDSLNQRGAELVANDPRVQRLPRGDVVISVPTSFVSGAIRKVFDQVASHVTLRLTGIKAHVAKSVKKVVKLGEFVVDVDIQEIVGRLKTKPPDIRFAGNRVELKLPVDLSSGYGKAKIHFKWDGKNVADLTCGDLDITQAVDGNVIPTSYLVGGRLDLALDSTHVICTPRIPPTKVRIRVKPTKQSWAAIDSILAEKHGVCGFVLDKVKVPSILQGIVEEKGFNIALPFSKLKPFRVPAGVSDSVTVGNRSVAVESSTNTLLVEPDAILYGGNVTLK